MKSKNFFFFKKKERNCTLTLNEIPSLMKPTKGCPNLDGVSCNRYSIIGKVKVLISIWNKNPIGKKKKKKKDRVNKRFFKKRKD